MQLIYFNATLQFSELLTLFKQGFLHFGIRVYVECQIWLKYSEIGYCHHSKTQSAQYRLFPLIVAFTLRCQRFNLQQVWWIPFLSDHVILKIRPWSPWIRKVFSTDVDRLEVQVLTFLQVDFLHHTIFTQISSWFEFFRMIIPQDDFGGTWA